MSSFELTPSANINTCRPYSKLFTLNILVTDFYLDVKSKFVLFVICVYLSSSCGVAMDDGDRHLANPFIGLENSVRLEGHEGDGELFKDDLAKAASLLMERLERRLAQHPHSLDEIDDHTVYTGTTGVTLMYWHLLQLGIIDSTPAIQTRLNSFLEKVANKKILKGRRFTFLCGDAGPLALALVMSTDTAQRKTFKRRLLDLQVLVMAESGRDGNPTPNELLYGRVGYVFALLWVNEKCRNNPGDDRIIPTSVISPIVSKIIDDGVKAASPSGPPLYFEWHEKEYLGAAHGYTGILYLLLKMKDSLNAKELKMVRETVDWMLAYERSPSGNLRSSVGSNRDKLVHWCHGAPGAIYLLVEAAKVYQDQKYLLAAVECGEVVWNRGILKTSYSLCHGTAGNAYSLMALFKHTKDETWLKRSCLFARWCFEWGSRATRSPDRPNSLFEGLAGNVYMLHDFSAYFHEPNKDAHYLPRFPAFELE